MSDSLTSLRDRLRLFAHERDWEQFHTPRNLACAISIEAGELLEHFLWKGDSTGKTVLQEEREAIAQEVADVLIYLVRLADVLEIDPVSAANDKIESNARRYPADLVRGTTKKHSEQ